LATTRAPLRGPTFVSYVSIDETLVDQQRLQGAHAELDVGQRRAMWPRAVIVLMLVLVIVAVMMVTHGG